MRLIVASTLSMLFGFSTVSFKTDGIVEPGIFIQYQEEIKDPKFLKMQPKNCNINDTSFEEAVKECLQKERRWLHL